MYPGSDRNRQGCSQTNQEHGGSLPGTSYSPESESDREMQRYGEEGDGKCNHGKRQKCKDPREEQRLEEEFDEKIEVLEQISLGERPPESVQHEAALSHLQGVININKAANPELFNVDAQSILNEVAVIRRLYEEADATVSEDKTNLAQSYGEKILARLYALRQHGILCDITLSVEGKEVHAHRVTLAGASNYFKALFTNGLLESRRSVINIPNITHQTMEEIVRFAYLGKCDINNNNVQDLLCASDRLSVLRLKEECESYLCKCIDEENCISAEKLADTFSCVKLKEVAYNFTMKNMVQVATQNEDLMQLPIDDFIKIISSDDLNIKDEKIVFETCIKWINVDPTERKKYIKTLLSNVRLGLLDQQYFVECVNQNMYVRDAQDCKDIIIQTMRYLYDLTIAKFDEPFIRSYPRLARPRIPHEVMFAFGGWSGGSPIKQLESYDTRADRWINLSDCEDPAEPRAYHGLVTLNQNIYAIGGFDGQVYFSSVRCFNPVTKVWSEVAPMNHRRCYVSTVVLDDCIYSLGGFDGQFRQNTAEKYDPLKNQWDFIAPMILQRSDAAAAVIGGKIYIVGGFNGQDCMMSGEVYDPQRNEWRTIPNMRERRSGVGLVAYRDCLYVLGGFNGQTRLSSCEKFDPAQNTWTPILDMYSPRSNFATEVLDDMIFVMGGFNGAATIFHCECYDGNTGEWLEATDMNIYRSALSACVVSDLPNREDYLTRNRDGLMEERHRVIQHRYTYNINQRQVTDNGTNAMHEVDGVWP